MDSFLSVDGFGGLGGLDYLFSGLGSLFGGDYGYYDDYGYNDYSYYDNYDSSFSVSGLDYLFGGDLLGGLFDDLGYLFGDYGYYDYSYNDHSYDDYEISGDVDDVIQVGADILNGLDDEIDVEGLISGLLNGEGDLSGLSDLLAGLLGGDTALSVDGELGDLSGLSDLLAGLLGGDTALSVDGEIADLSGLSELLSGLLGGDTTLSVNGGIGDLSGLSEILSGLLGGDTALSVDGELGDLSGLSEILAGLLGGDTALSVDGELGDLSGLSDILAGLPGGETSLSVDGTSDLLSGLLGGSGLDLSSLLSGLLGGGTTLSVDGTSDLLSGLSCLSGLGDLFGGLTGILGGIGNGDLDGFELLDSLTNLYNGAGISVDGTTSSTSADLLSGLLGGNGISSLLSGLLGGGTASTSGLDLSVLTGLLGGGTASTSGLDLSALLSGLLGGDTTLSVDGGTASTSALNVSALTSVLSALGKDTTLSVDGSTASTGSTDILSVFGNLSSFGNLFTSLAGILDGIDEDRLEGFELLDALNELYNGAGINVDGSTSSAPSTDTSDLLSGLSGLLAGTSSAGGLDITSILSGLTGGTTSTSGVDLSSVLSVLTGGTALTVDGGTASASGLDVSSLGSILSALGGETTLSVTGGTASTGSNSILSLFGNLGGLGNLFSGLTGILGGIGSGDLDGFELLDSLTDLYNGAGISVDGSTASTGSTDLLSALTGLLSGNGISSLLSGLIGGGTASSGGLDLSTLSSLSLLSTLLGGGTTSSSASDTPSTNSSYNIIGLLNLITESEALNGGQDVSGTSGVIIQISDDTWNMMRTTSVLNSILPGEDIFVNADGTQGIVLSTDTDSLQDALKPYGDYLTVNDLAVGLAITIDDLDGIQKAIALTKEDDPAVSDADPGTLITPASSNNVATTDPAILATDESILNHLLPVPKPIDGHVVDPLIGPPVCDVFQVELDSLREVGFWLDDASMDMGAQNWDGWDICAIGDFQGDGVDDLLLSHSQTGIMVLLGDSDLSKWDSLDQFVTNDPLSVGAIPAEAAGLCMVGDASQWLESGGASANWIILA